MVKADQDQPHKDRACVGRIAAPHGVKGLVKILPYGEAPSLIELCDTYTLTLKNRLGKYILAEIEGCADRTADEEDEGA